MKKYTGTIAQLIAQGLTINGNKPLDQSSMSVLTRLGMAREIGKMEKAPGTRGSAATIWEVDSEVTVTFDAVAPSPAIAA